LLKLTLFGSGNIIYADQNLVGFPDLQAYRLLCYLLIRRHRQHYREQLATLFWGDYPTPTARKYLRNALWRLRKALQTINTHLNIYVVVEGETIWFKPSHPYWLDIEQFETTLIQYNHLTGYQLNPSQVMAMEKAIMLYQGDLLKGMYDDWCLSERERLRMIYLNNLRKLMVYHEHNQAYSQALEHGERILAQDNTREAIHQQMMRLYWLAGDRDAALQQYRQCVQVLSEMIDLPPMPETTHLYQQILHDHPPTKKAVTIPAPIPPSLPQATQLTQALQRIEALEQVIQQAQTELQTLKLFLQQFND